MVWQSACVPSLLGLLPFKHSLHHSSLSRGLCCVQVLSKLLLNMHCAQQHGNWKLSNVTFLAICDNHSLSCICLPSGYRPERAWCVSYCHRWWTGYCLYVYVIDCISHTLTNLCSPEDNWQVLSIQSNRQMLITWKFPNVMPFVSELSTVEHM